MNAIQRLAKNIGSLFVSQVISYIVSFIYTIYLVRYLGVADFGILSFALSIISILTILSDLGLNILMTREVARDKSLTKKYLKNVISLKILLCVILIFLTIIIVNILGFPQTEIYIIYFLLIYLIFYAISGVFYSIFQSHEKLEYQSIANILNSLMMFIGILIIINYNSGLIIISMLYAITSGIILLYYLYISIKKFKFPLLSIEIDLKFWKPTLKTALQFGLIGVFETIYVWIDSVMLSFMAGNEAVGLYNAAYRIVLVLLFIPSVINVVIFPVMSKLYSTSENSVLLIVSKYLKFMIMISIPIGIGMTILAEDFIILLFGNAFLASAIPLQILIWATVITFINASYVQLLQSSNRQIIVTKLTFFAMIVNIGLNLILIPKYSYIAASFVTLFTEFTIAILLLIVAWKNSFLNKNELFKDFSMITVCGLIMGFFIVIFKEMNFFILILISAIIYITTLFITKTINKDDIQIIKQIRG